MTNFISTNEEISKENCVYCHNSLQGTKQVIELLELDSNDNETLVYVCGSSCEEQYYSAMEDAYELERITTDPYFDLTS
jgi:tRNA U54 and U55 pseudouridine synthase Pus10